MIKGLLKKSGYSPTTEIKETVSKESAKIKKSVTRKFNEEKKTLEKVFDKKITTLARSFAAASTGNLYSNWTTSSYSGDQEIKTDLASLRARSRELENDNPYAKKLFGTIVRNVIGAHGIRLQATTKDREGNLDDSDNAALESAWIDWGKVGNCDVTEQHSFRDLSKYAMNSIVRDGEVLIRIVEGYNNKYNFALQLIEADHLDINYNDTYRNGNLIKMGIEFNKWGKPVAYHVFKKHPGEFLMSGGGTYQYGERERIPSDKIIHLHIKNRVSSNRGLPWIHAAMTTLNMIGGYMEAEITAARMGAAKMGFLTTAEGGKYVGDSIDSTTGYTVNEVSPGEIENIGNMKFEGFDPQHPTTAFGPFLKTMLRAVASAGGIGYTSLSNDLEGVNFSSLKQGEADPRDFYRDIQQWLIDHLLSRIYGKWLKWAIVSGTLINRHGVLLPMSRYNKFLDVQWMPRGFRSIDAKETLYDAMAVKNGFMSEQELAAQRSGRPLDVIYDEMAAAKKMRADRGLFTEYDTKGLLELAKIAEMKTEEEEEVSQ